MELSDLLRRMSMVGTLLWQNGGVTHELLNAESKLRNLLRPRGLVVEPKADPRGLYCAIQIFDSSPGKVLSHRCGSEQRQ